MKYKIKPEYINKTVWTHPPTYKRNDGGKFILAEDTTQKDLGYLYEVIKYEGIEKDEDKHKE